MSLLIWSQGEDHFAILTDTLTTDWPHDRPTGFLSKLWPVASLNLVIGGTGSRLFVSAWARWVADSGVLDVDELHALAPDALRQLYAALLRQRQIGGTASTSTVYHFSVDQSGRAVHHAYRSTCDFAPEEDRVPGIAEKPAPTNGPIVFSNLEEMIAAGLEIRAQQDARPADERVHIGGELQLTIVRAGEIFTQRVHRFIDYEELAESMRPNGRWAAPDRALAASRI